MDLLNKDSVSNGLFLWIVISNAMPCKLPLRLEQEAGNLNGIVSLHLAERFIFVKSCRLISKCDFKTYFSLSHVREKWLAIEVLYDTNTVYTD